MSKSPSMTLSAIHAFEPCEDRSKFINKVLPRDAEITAQMARDAGCTFEDLVWIISKIARTDQAVDRLLRHWQADCATRVSHIYECNYPHDIRVRNAIIATRDFADRKINAAAWAAARAAAWAAARDAARDAARAAAWAAETEWQFDRLMMWLSGDEPKPLELPEKRGVVA